MAHLDIFSLDGKTAVITGGYGYLGSTMAEALMQKGANVIILGKSIEKFRLRFGVRSESFVFMKGDVSDTESLANVFKQVYNEYGSIDILVNNAHYAKGHGMSDISDDDWSYTIDGVLGSVYRCIRGVKDFMIRQCSGKIINIASMYGLVSPYPAVYEGEGCELYKNPPHYGAGKAGVIQLTKYFATELGRYNIHVNSITPGPFPNPEVQKENPAFIERLKSKTPLGKIGQPEDISGLLILLSSSSSDFITGQNFIVDGGWTVW